MLVNACVGSMVGTERSILPAIAEQESGLAARAAILSFLLAFGVSKALANDLAGRLPDRHGRKPVLVAGWAIAAPVPFLLMRAPGWEWVVAAHLPLGVSQGLTWSTAVIMKIDLAGPRRRGLAMGLDAFAGCLAVARGPGLSALLVRETRHHAAHEARTGAGSPLPGGAEAQPSEREVFLRAAVTGRDLSGATRAGRGQPQRRHAWGLFPLAYAAAGPGLAEIGVRAALYRAVRGVAQLATGARSDRVGRKCLIAGGMAAQAGGVAAIALAAGSGSARPRRGDGLSDAVRRGRRRRASGLARASAVGVDRLWRDLGHAFGAVAAGLIADAPGLGAALWTVAALTFAPGRRGGAAHVGDAAPLRCGGGGKEGYRRMSRALFILNDPPYGTERCYNALRLALALFGRDPNAAVTVFLMADAVGAARRGQKVPEGHYSLERMLKRVLAGQGRVLLCGTCMDARGMADGDILEGARRSTMDELAAATAEADKVLVF